MDGACTTLERDKNAQNDRLRKSELKRQFRRPSNRQVDIKMDLKDTRWGSVGGSYMTEHGNVYWGLRTR